MAIEKNIKINVNTDEAVKDVKKLDSSIDGVNESTSALTGTLDKMTGGAVSKLKGFAGGLKGVALGFKSVGAAIAASGIGLLVIIVASLIAAFKGSEDGQNKFAKLMAVIGAVVGNVVDVLADLGDFIIDLFSGNGEAMTKLKSFGKSIFNVIGLPIKNVIDTVKALGKALGALFSGDISGAFDELKKGVADVKTNFDEAKTSIDGVTGALKDFVKQNIDEAAAAAKVADQRAKADKIERDLIVDRAKAEGKIADLRLKAKDLNKVSAKEREKALNDVLAIQDDLITRETEVLELRRDAQIAENTFARSNKENLTAEQDAIAAVIQAQTRRVDQQRQIQRELTAAQNEQNAEAKARKTEQDAQDALDLKAAEDKAMAEIDRELSIARALKKIREDEEAEEEARAEREIDRELAVSRALKKIREDEAATELKLNELKAQARQKQLAGIGNALSQTSDLLGEATAEGKALAIASAGISTFLTAQQAYQAAFQPVPTVASPVLGAIFAAVAVAGGLANIAKIAAVKVPGGKGGGRGGVSGGASAPPAPSFNLVQGTGTNQISQSINNQNQNPQKSYVVSKDVSSGLELERNIEQNSAL